VNANGGADFTSIEDAISYIISIGGGDIFVHTGTYTITKNIPTITVPLNIIGTATSLVVIDFNSTSRNFASNSGTPYTTGTISSITSGVNVTGSGTLWLANASAGQFMFLGTRWYQIAAVTSNTTLVLAEAYIDDISLSAYRIATLTRNVGFDSLTIKNSTGNGIQCDDVRDVFLRDVLFLDNNKGFALTNVSHLNIDNVVSVSSTSNGCDMTNVGLGTVKGLSTPGNGGVGVAMSNVKSCSFTACASESNSSVGVQLTSCDTVYLNFIANGNSIGIECVSGNKEIDMMNCHVQDNTSDGIKLTASSDFCKVIGGHFDTNGGYGVNVAAVADDKNVVTGNSFNANVSGTVNDAGTGSVVASNTT